MDMMTMTTMKDDNHHHDHHPLLYLYPKLPCSFLRFLFSSNIKFISPLFPCCFSTIKHIMILLCCILQRKYTHVKNVRMRMREELRKIALWNNPTIQNTTIRMQACFCLPAKKPNHYPSTSIIMIIIISSYCVYYIASHHITHHIAWNGVE